MEEVLRGQYLLLAARRWMKSRESGSRKMALSRRAPVDILLEVKCSANMSFMQLDLSGMVGNKMKKLCWRVPLEAHLIGQLNWEKQSKMSLKDEFAFQEFLRQYLVSLLIFVLRYLEKQ